MTWGTLRSVTDGGMSHGNPQNLNTSQIRAHCMRPRIGAECNQPQIRALQDQSTGVWDASMQVQLQVATRLAGTRQPSCCHCAQQARQSGYMNFCTAQVPSSPESRPEELTEATCCQK